MSSPIRAMSTASSSSPYPVTRGGQTILTQHFFAHKRGPTRNTFSPEHIVFLSERLNDFLAAVSQGELPDFWRTTFDDYWTKFPWRLPLHVDPHSMMTLDTVPLTRDELDQRTVLKLTTQGRIKAWFQYKRTLRARLGPAAATAPTNAGARSLKIRRLAFTFPRHPLHSLVMYTSIVP
ncbi:hypothetical protein C8F04DRAFT_1192245 [Mycena alexandri]|uniref:Uncharacterized protein n=1 Tax=Mycena alexandri TaxID=1745969 RepID=A0AAD6SC82_9AGAR|nr:hypothetical protein C8F04DRAFT_1192240 [Mycena alexandri]KAJ7024572.1 hypothetical protein C8F04DRAFT_1192245 [Mycena alexandri]